MKKQIEKIYRKAALKLVRMSPASNALAVITSKGETATEPVVPQITVDSDNLKEYVGSPLFTSERMYEKTPPGVVMGLAWTSLGKFPLIQVVHLFIWSQFLNHFQRRQEKLNSAVPANSEMS